MLCGPFALVCHQLSRRAPRKAIVEVEKSTVLLVLHIFFRCRPHVVPPWRGKHCTHTFSSIVQDGVAVRRGKVPAIRTFIFCPQDASNRVSPSPASIFTQGLRDSCSQHPRMSPQAFTSALPSAGFVLVEISISLFPLRPRLIGLKSWTAPSLAQLCPWGFALPHTVG